MQHADLRDVALSVGRHSGILLQETTTTTGPAPVAGQFADEHDFRQVAPDSQPPKRGKAEVSSDPTAETAPKGRICFLPGLAERAPHRSRPDRQDRRRWRIAP